MKIYGSDEDEMDASQPNLLHTNIQRLILLCSI